MCYLLIIYNQTNILIFVVTITMFRLFFLWFLPVWVTFRENWTKSFVQCTEDFYIFKVYIFQWPRRLDHWLGHFVEIICLQSLRRGLWMYADSGLAITEQLTKMIYYLDCGMKTTYPPEWIKFKVGEIPSSFNSSTDTWRSLEDTITETLWK